MMPIPRLFGALVCGALLQGCWDDPESPTNRPPDLRMEDVVGCWNREGVAGSCAIQCFDVAGFQHFHEQDSGNSGNIREVFETVGWYRLVEWSVQKKVVGIASGGLLVDSIESKQPLKRVGPDLYTLTPELQLATRFTPVNLDSTLPCGTPFQLLPKPEGWTLF